MEKYVAEYREPTTHITNRHGLKLAVWVDEVENSQGVVYGHHGMYEGALGPHNQAALSVLKAFGYTTVFFDASHHGNFSEGLGDNLTWFTHFNDLHDVIQWGQQQDWAHGVYSLYGRSLGGTAAFWHAASSPDSVERVVALSPPVSRKLLSEAFDSTTRGIWKRVGKVMTRNNTSGLDTKACFDSYGLNARANLLEIVDRITMPALLMVGTEDVIATGVDELYRQLPNPTNDMKALPGKDHNMLRSKNVNDHPDPDALRLIKSHITQWFLAQGLEPVAGQEIEQPLSPQ